MKCKECGSQVKDGAKFCRECGSEIVIETTPLKEKICAGCGTLLGGNALFCNNCGRQVASENSKPESTNRCPKCNSLLKEGALFCGKCGASLTGQAEKTKTTKQPKKNGGLIFLIVLLFVVLICSTAVIGYLYYQNNFVDTETPSVEVSTKEKTEDISKTKENSTVEEIEENSTVEEIEESSIVEAIDATEEEPEYMDDNFDVEEEVLRIRELYNSTQANLSSLSKNNTESGKVKYYDSDSRLVRMDISTNSITSYTKYYYFEDGNLYFAFVFDGTKENRLYFKDNRLFRWIDESGKTHDKERSNNTFLEWEKIVLDDLNS